MRGWIVTIIVFVCAAVVSVAYHFLVVAQLDKKLAELRAEDDKLQSDLNELIKKEAEIPHLLAAVPAWKQRVDLYQAAIPSSIDDEVFLGYLNEQLRAQNVTLISVQMAPGGSWLGSIKEAEATKLEGMGVDVEVARKLRVAFYTIELNGTYHGVIQAFENMKQHRRIYSIDQIVSPAGRGGGQVLQVLDSAETPMRVTGKLFYGVPENYVSQAQLDAMVYALESGGKLPAAPEVVATEDEMDIGMLDARPAPDARTAEQPETPEPGDDSATEQDDDSAAETGATAEPAEGETV